MSLDYIRLNNSLGTYFAELCVIFVSGKENIEDAGVELRCISNFDLSKFNKQQNPMMTRAQSTYLNAI